MPVFLPLVAAVLACDGSNAGGPPRNQRPSVTILQPPPGTTAAESTAITFLGSATDPEDGPLTGAALTWSSSVDGALGTGGSITLPTLSPGQHTITLRATDTEGASGSGTIGLTVTPLHPPPSLQLVTVATGLSQPVFLTSAPGDPSRLFVVEKTGRIRIIRNGALEARPFLDLSDSVAGSSEQGLLGMAFDPQYGSTGRFYVSYTSVHNGMSVLARYRVAPTNADSADPASGQTLLTVDQPFANHNGGGILFGPDGFLYMGLGDGGSSGDPLKNGQDRTDLLGSILRLDVSGAGSYTVPASNPYAGRATFRPELWNYGLRNPWRFSFDRQTGDLYIGDVGQNAREEVDVQPAASGGGENYGWSIMEGLQCYNASSCDQAGLTLPVLDYDHSQGCAITGGYVYRGTAIPGIQGRYFYSDYCGGWVRSFRYQGGQAIDRQSHNSLDTGASVTSFGEDAAGELYLLTQQGTVYRIAAN
jgi:glucose/arabinose dehydrogenase